MECELSSLHAVTLTRWIIYQHWRSHLLEARSGRSGAPGPAGAAARACRGLWAAWERRTRTSDLGTD
jgi:hypothetical protein